MCIKKLSDWLPSACERLLSVNAITQLYATVKDTQRNVFHAVTQLKIHRVSKKYQHIFALCWSTDFNKNKNKNSVGMSWKKHLTKLCRNCPSHLKYVIALPWEIWSDRLNRQRSTYMYILMNHWIATNTTASYYLNNSQTCSRSHYLYIICSKCLRSAWTKARKRWRYVANCTFDEQRDSNCSLVRSFLMGHLSLSTSKIWIRAGDGHFERVM